MTKHQAHSKKEAIVQEKSTPSNTVRCVQAVVQVAALMYVRTHSPSGSHIHYNSEADSIHSGGILRNATAKMSSSCGGPFWEEGRKRLCAAEHTASTLVGSPMRPPACLRACAMPNRIGPRLVQIGVAHVTVWKNPSYRI